MLHAPIPAAAAASLSLGSSAPPAAAILAAAEHILSHLEQGRTVDAATLRSAMEDAFGASDAVGAWDWKAAYDACEVATVLFLRKYGKPLFRKAASPASRLSALAKIVGLLPTHTRRSEEAQAFQQFSTPVPLGLAALTAATLTPADRVLEPSAGTGLLAVLAETAGASLVLNELAETRADLLTSLFPGLPVTRFDAAQIDDHLDPAAVPSVVIMNPPFSVMANVTGRVADAAYRHIASALARLADGGRLVAVTGANFSPELPAWRDAFVRLQARGRVVFTAAIAGSVYAKHGTTIETRLTVIDKAPAQDPEHFLDSAGVAPNVATLLGWIDTQLPARLPVSIARPAAMPATTDLLLDEGRGIFGARVYTDGRPETLGQIEFGIVDINGDDIESHGLGILNRQMTEAKTWCQAGMPKRRPGLSPARERGASIGRRYRKSRTKPRGLGWLAL